MLEQQRKFTNGWRSLRVPLEFKGNLENFCVKFHAKCIDAGGEHFEALSEFKIASFSAKKIPNSMLLFS